MTEVVPLMIGTAGHVDHGKTTLLKRLVGGAPETDRLPEEQTRGLTIDIGYAQLDLGGRHVGVVDVPGHERFIRNMVAAASGIDLILLVVAADDGVMPQTREHLEIADLLGAGAGVAVVTKTDLVDEDLALAAEEEVRDLLAGTVLRDSPIVRVSAVTGEGIEALKAAILSELDRARPRPPEGIFRLPVQRSFMLEGHGTVVTGVPLSGSVEVGQTLEVVPGHRKCRVRAIQAYHHEVMEGRAGHRTALKLSDVSWREVRRGNVVAEPGFLGASHLLEARFACLARRPRGVASNLSVRLHTGTAEVLGRLFLLERKEIAPGEDGLVQLRLDRPVVAAPGDRFVLRTPSPQVTLGGGWIIGPSTRKISPGKARLVRRVERREEGLTDLVKAVHFVVSGAGLVPVTRADLARQLVRRTEELEPAISELTDEGALEPLGDRLLAVAEIERGRKALRDVLDRFHRREPLRKAAGRAWAREQLSVGDAVLDALVAAEPEVETVEGGRLKLTAFSPGLSEAQRGRLERIEEIVREKEFSTPRVSELPDLIGTDLDEATKLVDLLVEDGSVVKLGGGVLLHHESMARAKEEIAGWIGANGPIAPADVKALLGMSRKYSIPLFEWLDETRFTIRQGDRRILA
ncbi:MAG: selenocysteine-specific translation elongation factor [Planctomycetota bacterium]|jgi:selenocysteine-specific elongation factor